MKWILQRDYLWDYTGDEEFDNNDCGQTFWLKAYNKFKWKLRLKVDSGFWISQVQLQFLSDNWHLLCTTAEKKKVNYYW